MKLKYKILWFEDIEGWRNSMERILKSHLEELGFELTTQTFRRDHPELENLLDQNDFDLILIDLNLEETTGDIIIEKIRQLEPITEIIFYSQSDINTIRKAVSEKGLDGIYFANRNTEDFVEKVKKVINNTIKKVQDVNNMRGLVIAETTELELVLKNLLKTFYSAKSVNELDSHRKRLYEKMCDRKMQQLNDGIKEFESLKTRGIDILIKEGILTFKNLFNATQSIVNDRIRQLNKNIMQESDERKKMDFEKEKHEIEQINIQLRKFDEEIIVVRNILAHAVEKNDADGVPYLEGLDSSGTKIKFDNERYIEIRKAIRVHRKNLENLVNYMFSELEYIDEAASGASI